MIAITLTRIMSPFHIHTYFKVQTALILCKNRILLQADYISFAFFELQRIYLNCALNLSRRPLFFIEMPHFVLEGPVNLS
jgi:hypothetical protein